MTTCPGSSCTGLGSVTFVDPTGNPQGTTAAQVGTSELSFTPETWGVVAPAVLTVVIRMRVTAPLVMNLVNKVRVCISSVGNSTLQWQTMGGAPCGWNGTTLGIPGGANVITGRGVYNPLTGNFEVRAVFTNMPPNNSDFGPKIIWGQVVEPTGVVVANTQPIEVFYPRWDSTGWDYSWNNPGTGADTGPNWFYYWKTGNVCGTTTGWEYEDSSYLGVYYSGDPFVYVCWYAPETGAGPFTLTNKYTSAQIIIDGWGRGPFCCAEVITHENTHKYAYDNWYNLMVLAAQDGVLDGDPYDDPDDDGVPNCQEPIWLGIDSDPNDPDTYDFDSVISGYASYGDNEVRGRKAELSMALVVTPGADWCMPGMNSFPVYP
jgi:hypothetical protein